MPFPTGHITPGLAAAPVPLPGAYEGNVTNATAHRGSTSAVPQTWAARGGTMAGGYRLRLDLPARRWGCFLM